MMVYEVQENPLVTIIIWCYKKCDKIQRAIDSILQQTYKNIELIIAIDECSDTTRDIVNSINGKISNRISVFCNEHICNLENAYIHANGKYICVLKCNDFLYPQKTEQQINYMASHDSCDICFTFIDIDTDTGAQKVKYENLYNREALNNYSQKELFKKILVSNCLCSSSAMMRYDKFIAYGGYNYNYRKLCDYMLYLRAIQSGDFYIIPDKLTGCKIIMENSDTFPCPDINISASNEKENVIYKVFYEMSADFFYNTFYPSEEKASNYYEVICQKIKYLVHSEDIAAIQAGSRLFYENTDRPDGGLSNNEYCETKGKLYALINENTIYKRYENILNQNSVILEMYRQKRFDFNNLNKSDEILVNELCDLIDAKDPDKWNKFNIDHLIALYDICKKIQHGDKMFSKMIESIVKIN